MPKYQYKFSHQIDTYIVEASTRQEAIDLFNKRSGIPHWFIKKHFKIKKVWKIK